MEISKQDCKLFRERIGGWQEAYMARLCREYSELLQSDRPASDRFWALEKRIRADKRNPGVLIELCKGDVPMDLISLVSGGVITLSDLDGFSEDLRDTVEYFVKSHASEPE